MSDDDSIRNNRFGQRHVLRGITKIEYEWKRIGFGPQPTHRMIVTYAARPTEGDATKEGTR